MATPFKQITLQQFVQPYADKYIGLGSLDGMQQFLSPVATTAALADPASDINTLDKYIGKPAYDSDTALPVWASGPDPADTWDGAGGGVVTPGGADTQLQYNDGGAFGGVPSVTYNDGTGVLDFNSLAGANQAQDFRFLDGMLVDSNKHIEFGDATTYITGNSGDVIDIVAGGTHRFTSAGLNTVGGLIIPPTFQIKLDGNPSDTNIRESSANVMTLQAGGTDALAVQSDRVDVDVDIFRLGATAANRVAFNNPLSAGSLTITIENGGNLQILDGNTGNALRYDFDVDAGALQMDGNLDLAYIDGYAGSPADGEVLTWVTANSRAEFLAAAGSSTQVIEAFKTADQTKVSDNTLNSDNAISFVLDANSHYRIECMIEVENPNTTPDFKFRWLAFTGTWYLQYSSRRITVSTGAAVGTNIESSHSNAFTTDSVITMGTAQRALIHFDILVHSGSAPNNFFLVWAQNVANVNPTTVKAGSWAIATKIA